MLFFTRQSLSYINETNTPEFPKPTCLYVHLASYKERFCTERAYIRCPLLSLSSPSNECQATMNLTNVVTASVSPAWSELVIKAPTKSHAAAFAGTAAAMSIVFLKNVQHFPPIG